MFLLLRNYCGLLIAATSCVASLSGKPYAMSVSMVVITLMTVFEMVLYVIILNKSLYHG